MSYYIFPLLAWLLSELWLFVRCRIFLIYVCSWETFIWHDVTSGSYFASYRVFRCFNSVGFQEFCCNDDSSSSGKESESVKLFMSQLHSSVFFPERSFFRISFISFFFTSSFYFISTFGSFFFELWLFFYIFLIINFHVLGSFKSLDISGHWQAYLGQDGFLFQFLPYLSIFVMPDLLFSFPDFRVQCKKMSWLRDSILSACFLIIYLAWLAKVGVDLVLVTTVSGR